MRGEQRQPDGLARRFPEQLADGADIAERLRHLGAVIGEKAVVQPIVDKGPAGMGANALRDFVLVMRKDQVETAGVDVEGLAEMRLAHRRALDGPAGPAATPRAVPARHVWI